MLTIIEYVTYVLLCVYAYGALKCIFFSFLSTKVLHSLRGFP